MPWGVLMIRRVAVALLASVVLAAPALAHKERFDPSPIGTGPEPSAFIGRRNARVLVVCKASSKPTKAELQEIRGRIATSTGDELAQALAEEANWKLNTKLFKRCRYEHIQEAVNAAPDFTDIFVMPGVYREEPSRLAPTSDGGDLPDGAYSYEYHVAHPNDANLIAILGKKGITLEGTGLAPEDVLVDVGFAKDIGIRCDKCEQFIVRNLWERDANEHGIYVLYSDGYIFDRTRGTFNKDYSLFGYASDHGLFTDCDAEGGGDSGLYIGAAPVPMGRFAAEVRNTKMHHSALGFSGTQGSAIWMHDNDVYDNAIGLSFDSENDHQNFPQRESLIENNLLHDNNFDIYAATADVPAGGPGYDFFRYPVGTGMWLIGGEDNIIRNNRVWNNSRFGILLAGNALESPLPATINRNQVYGNIVGIDPDGNPAPNAYAFPPGGDYAPGGSDFFWDETGNDNCWNPQDPASGPIVYDPPAIPGPCPAPNMGVPIVPPLPKLELLLSCTMDTSADPPHTSDTFYPCPFGQVNEAPYLNGDEQECGNGLVDLGEDCDPGSIYGGSGGGAFVPAETCGSLGHGPGALACGPYCTWDTSGCTADRCEEYGASRSKLRNLAPPAGDDQLDFRAKNLPGGVSVVDPLTEEVSVVFRDDQGLVHAATIPAGNGNWSANGATFTYADLGGTQGGITAMSLAASSGLAAGYRAVVRVRGVDLSGAADARTGTLVVRVGDDCWSDTTPCTPKGSNLTCRGRNAP
jgi:parallel beta-helix repeat protein